jgi:hypothetical protein
MRKRTLAALVAALSLTVGAPSVALAHHHGKDRPDHSHKTKRAKDHPDKPKKTTDHPDKAKHSHGGDGGNHQDGGNGNN